MATLKIRGESYSVIYLYTAADGQKKQQWETYVTELEALQRKTYIEYLQKNKMKKELQLAAVSYRQQRVHEKEGVYPEFCVNVLRGCKQQKLV